MRTPRYSKLAKKNLERLDAPTKKRIRAGINGLPNGNVKKLQGHDELYRLRIGDWRIVFSYPDEKTTLIERISPRGGIYKEV